MIEGKGKLALALLCVFMLAVVLASCGGGDGSTSSGGSGSGAETSSQRSTDTTSDGGAGDSQSSDHAKGSKSGSVDAASDGSSGEAGGSSSNQGKSSGGSSGSGGGSGQQGGGSAEPSAEFRVPNGDNSIQTYGDEAGDADREAASAVLESYMAARADADWVRACTQLFPATVSSLETVLAPGGGCVGTMTAIGKRVPPSSLANTMTGPIASLRREGEHGFALYHGTNNTDYFIQMTIVGGTWKVAAIEPTAFP